MFYKLSEFKILDNVELGRGYKSVVKVCVHSSTKKKYAVKIIDLKHLTVQEQTAIQKEIRIQRQLHHPHIIKIYAYFIEKSKLYLILELIDRGTLHSRIFGQRMSEEEIVAVSRQIFLALRFMHDKGIIHRDIKPENILVDSEGKAKLCDFGFSSFLTQDEKRRTICGTIEYFPPEILDR